MLLTMQEEDRPEYSHTVKQKKNWTEHMSHYFQTVDRRYCRIVITEQRETHGSNVMTAQLTA